MAAFRVGPSRVPSPFPIDDDVKRRLLPWEALALICIEHGGVVNVLENTPMLAQLKKLGLVVEYRQEHAYTRTRRGQVALMGDGVVPVDDGLEELAGVVAGDYEHTEAMVILFAAFDHMRVMGALTVTEEVILKVEKMTVDLRPPPITNRWRCTRPLMYPPGSPGHDNPGARQGYYVDADTESDARLHMARLFPGETEDQFDVELWLSAATGGG